MSLLPTLTFTRSFLAVLMPVLGFMGCSSASTKTPRPPATAPKIVDIADSKPAGPNNEAYPVMLGIDVLESRGFDVLKGKRVGLLTHQAGVNRQGESTVDVLRRAKGVKLVALYAGEHGIRGEIPAGQNFNDSVDGRTGLPVYSLYTGKSRWASPAQLKSIDVLVIDLQDIGTRSYTFISAMRYALESCFKAGKEVVVLDRPNPLGGLKVDGPPMDRPWMSYVGAFTIPYVHGLTMGELANIAWKVPGSLDIPEETRLRGKLTVVPMRGWKRSMRWPETGLRWVATSPRIQDYAAVLGYPMTGLGCEVGGFRHGVGDQHVFRGISHRTANDAVLERDLKALRIPGLRFVRIQVQNRQGKPATGIFVDVTDFDAWRPTELSFHMMRLACRYEGKNPFAALPLSKSNTYLIHMGSTEFMEAIRRDGSKVNVESFIAKWEEHCRAFQTFTRKYWLYQP